MTLNAVIALILRFAPNSIDLQADYVTVVEDRHIISVKYCLPVPVFHFWPSLIHPAARSLCHLLKVRVTLEISDLEEFLTISDFSQFAIYCTVPQSQ